MTKMRNELALFKIKRERKKANRGGKIKMTFGTWKYHRK